MLSMMEPDQYEYRSQKGTALFKLPQTVPHAEIDRGNVTNLIKSTKQT